MLRFAARRIRLFLHLDATQRYLLGKAVLLLGMIRLGLWLLPFRVLRRLVASATQGRPELPDVNPAVIGQVVWAVRVASRYVPEATCLTQALATQIILARRGYPVNLRIGVARSEAGEFQAHAWVECQGKVVIGGAEAPSRFTPLPSLERKNV